MHIVQITSRHNKLIFIVVEIDKEDISSKDNVIESDEEGQTEKTSNTRQVTFDVHMFPNCYLVGGECSSDLCC